jgi:O-antigen/teichoic acid export membrane protein
MSMGLYGARAVKSSARAYLIGRGVSALITFAAFALAARSMDVPEYGAYMLALATAELGMALATGGLDWVANRHLPEYRIHASGSATVRFVILLGALQTTTLCLVATAFWLSAEHIAVLSGGIAPPSAVKAAALLLLIEGTGRLLRDQFLGILMLQWLGQTAQILRSSTLASLFVASLLGGEPMSALDALRYEAVAALLALLAGLCGLIWQLLKLARTPTSDASWSPPPLCGMARLAAHMYASYLLALAYGPQIITFIVSRMLGAEAVALYGFARTFADQVRRYLPTDMLQSVVRPALVAHFSRQRDFADLSVRLRLWFKSALWMLAPIVIAFIALQKLASSLIGGGAFADAWLLTAVLLAGTAGIAYRRVGELAANIVMEPDLCARAAVLLLAVPFAVWGVLTAGGGVVWVGVVVSVSEFVFCQALGRMLEARGHRADRDSRWTRWVSALVVTTALACLAARYSALFAVIVLGSVWLAFLFKGGLLSRLEQAVLATASPRLAAWIR